MEMLSHPIIAVVLLLGILVVVHEAGHFIVGKLFGIPVEVFSIGFGPVIFGMRKGETEYRLSIIPLGGFVKFYGTVPSEEVPESIKGREFFRASKKARLATIAAGPLANLILAIVVFSLMIMHGIQQPPPIIGEVLPNSPAEIAGIRLGDKVLAIDGSAVKSWKDIQRMIGDSPRKPLQFSLERDSAPLNLAVVPDSVKDEDLPGQRGRIGISRVMIPSVIAVVKKDGMLSRAGMRTGDRFLRAEWNGKTYELKYWQQVLRFFNQVSYEHKADQANIVTLYYRSFVPDEPGKIVSVDKPVEERIIQMTMPSDWKLEAGNFVDQFGITSAELTIFGAEAPVEGLLKGDILQQWDEKKIGNAFELSNILASQSAPTALLLVLRNDKLVEVTISLKAVEVQKAEGKVIQYTLPVNFWGALEQPDWILEQQKNPLSALIFGFGETWDMTRSIGRAIAGLFTGEMPLTTLGGPIAIAKVASDSVRIGWQAFFSALALISINLALLNLIPIPILDGGQIVLILAEAGLRKPVPEVAIENYQKIGFVMVLALFVIATYNDVGRFWASMVRGLSSMF